MRKNILILFVLGIFASCNLILGEHIQGNGNYTTETRNISSAQKIKLAGDFDVDITQSDNTSLSVDADANLLPYIEIFNEDGWLVVRAKEHANLDSKKGIKIHITTPVLQACKIAGSGNIAGKGKFTGGDHLELAIAGSGDINLDVNTPSVKGDIAGSGNVILNGETRSEVVKIAGNGDWKTENLKAENVEIHIAGSGNVHVFADNKLSVHVAGSGDVYYKGNPTIDQHIAGSGNIKKTN